MVSLSLQELSNDSVNACHDIQHFLICKASVHQNCKFCSLASVLIVKDRRGPVPRVRPGMPGSGVTTKINNFPGI